MRRVLTIGACAWWLVAGCAWSQTRSIPAGYERAEYVFNVQHDLQFRIDAQIDLIATGYLNAVPLDRFDIRVYEATRRFQVDRGMTGDGVLDQPTRAKLLNEASGMYRLWRFRSSQHPSRPHSIWIPTGMELAPKANKNGLGYASPDGKISLNYNHFPDRTIAETFAALLESYERNGVKIHYKVAARDQFVLSTTSKLGTDGYLRYYADGGGVTGFALFWNNERGNVSGERIAVLMSASLRSSITGAAFLAPPKIDEVGTALIQPSPQPSAQPRYEAPTPVVAAPPNPPVPQASVSTGTGFFVAQDGLLVTNAHVVDGCTGVQVRTEDRNVHRAAVIAYDKTNDLALLRTAVRPSRVASLRMSARMGESVAAFGFPHTDLLATTGNFTLGNVTATSGMEDDSRFFQISAPIQSGNSGGPLLDERGNVVGIVTAKLNAMKVALRLGDLTQNVNFAVKANLVAGFVSTNNVDVQPAVAQGERLQPADLADIARAISVFVMCR